MELFAFINLSLKKRDLCISLIVSKALQVSSGSQIKSEMVIYSGERISGESKILICEFWIGK